jgi:hypothetical protein
MLEGMRAPTQKFQNLLSEDAAAPAPAAAFVSV